MILSKFLTLSGFVTIFVLNLYAAAIPENKNELDSIKVELSTCSTDICEFDILSNMFWKYYFTEFNHAKYYGEWAYSIIKNSTNPTVLVDGYHIKAHILRDEGYLDSAYYFFKKSLPIAIKINYTFQIAWSYYRLGELDYSFGNTRKALEEFKLAEKYFNEFGDVELIKTINYAIEEKYQSLGFIDSSIMDLEEKNTAFKKYPDQRWKIYAYLKISNSYKRINNVKKSAEYLFNALRLADSLKDENALVHVFWEIGDSFLERKKNYVIARNYYDNALRYTKKLNLPGLTAQLYSIIGRTYMEEGQCNTALSYSFKGLKISKEKKYWHALLYSYINLGYTYKKLKNYKLALDNFKKCLEIKPTDFPEIIFHEVLTEIGDIYMELNDCARAFYWYDKTLTLAEKSNNTIAISISMFKLGDYYYKTKKFKNAEDCYLLSLQKARFVKSFLLVKDIADSLSKYYLFRNDYKSAVPYLELARAMSDSLANREQQANMTKLEMNFEFEKLKKDNEIRVIKAGDDLKKQRTFLYFLILVSILFAALCTVIYISYIRKKKDNTLLAEQKKELTIQKNEIEKISEQLHDADQMKLAFFTNISHELRTPLSLILSPLAKLIKSKDDGETGMLYSLMYRNTRKLQKLINQLLDISKLDKGEEKLDLKLHDFNELVRITASMFQSIAEEKEIIFNIKVKTNELIFSFDAEKIELILNNLLSNAFKFTHKGGEINLETQLINNSECVNFHQTELDFVEIKVRDNGIGIPPENIGKIFDRFYQCDSTITRNYEGSGIGLSLVKQLVELHNGKISVESIPGSSDKPGSGCTEFKILIPAVKGESSQVVEEYNPVSIVEGDDDVSRIISPSKNQIQSKLSGTILLVEDNNDLRTYLSSYLSRIFNVLIACNGIEGINIAVKSIPDIIISDVMMPEMDGYQLTENLKENIETSHIPVILLTAKAGYDSKMEGLKKGAVDYIIKPFEEDELIQKIENILKNRYRLQEKYRKQISVNPSEVSTKSLDEQFLLKLTSIIEEEISNPDLDVNTLCNKIGLSRSQLFKKLKALTDLSISQFVSSIRLKRAAQLLKMKSGSVSEIAYMTGFENLSYFSKKFKEQFGKIPSEY